MCKLHSYLITPYIISDGWFHPPDSWFGLAYQARIGNRTGPRLTLAGHAADPIVGLRDRSFCTRLGMLGFEMAEDDGFLLVTFEDSPEGRYDGPTNQRQWLYQAIDSRTDPRFVFSLSAIS